MAVPINLLLLVLKLVKEVSRITVMFFLKKRNQTMACFVVNVERLFIFCAFLLTSLADENMTSFCL